MAVLMRLWKATMELNIKASGIREREIRWHVHKDKFFLVFNACAHFLPTHSCVQEYYFLGNFRRKAEFFGYHADFDSLYFSLNNIRFENRHRSFSQLISTDVFANQSKNPFGADIVVFNVLVPFCVQPKPTNLLGWIEAKMHPATSKMYFGKSGCFFD